MLGSLQAQVEGTWKLAPEAQALAVGPALGDFSWWSNTADDVTTRACFFDDKFVFNADGTFENIMDGETWLEAWQGMDPEGCGVPVAPHDGSAAATWSFDEAAGELTITGTGAHIGLAKVVNGAELGNPADAPESIVYPVTFDGNRMIVDINFGPGFWHFVFEKEMETSVLSDTKWVLAPKDNSLAVGPALGDFSWWAITEADTETRACLYDDQFVFNADGTFENVQGEQTWIEAWQGMDPEGCGAPVAPHDGSNAATWSYDEGTGELTLTGVGAHLGLAKVINGAEIGNPADAPESIVYPVTFNGDTMLVDINFGPGFWHFELVPAPADNTVEISQEDLFNFYPNPARTTITIESDSKLDQVLIRDYTGRVAFSQSSVDNFQQIDISSLTSGIYFIEARSGNKVSVEKLLVN